MLPELIEQGDKFTYANFSSKSQHGYTNAFSEDWLVWTHHVSIVAKKVGDSVIGNSIERGLDMMLIGYGQPEFDSSKALIVSGLRAANRVFGQQIPASDRVVSLGHNSPEQTEALARVDELIQAVEQANEFPGDADDKELMVAELSAGRRLLQAANVRAAALRETIQPALKWIAEKSAGAALGKLAGDLMEYLIHLKFW
jgi:hypothetical protein